MPGLLQVLPYRGRCLPCSLEGRVSKGEKGIQVTVLVLDSRHRRGWESRICVASKLRNEMEVMSKKYIQSLAFWVTQMLDLGFGLFSFALRGGPV